MSATSSATAGAAERPPADWRLAPAALLAWAIAAAGLAAPGLEAWLGAGCAAGLAATSALGLRARGVLRRDGRRAPAQPSGLQSTGRPMRRRGGGGAHGVLGLLAVTSAAGALAAVATSSWLAHLVPAPVAEAIDAGPVAVELVVTGLVDDAAVESDVEQGGRPGFGTRFRANLVSIAPPRESPRELDVPVLVSGSIRADTTPGPGTRIAADARLREAPAAERIAAYVSLKGAAEVVAEPSGVLAGAAQLRAGFRELAAGLPGGGAELLPGLAVGDDRGVSAELDQAMRDSSLSHLTAVSGANCALVVGLVLLAGRALGIGRGIRLASAGLALAAFTLLVTPQGSVIRAAAMAGLVLGVEGAGRRIGGPPVLCLAVLVLLVADPGLALDAGFALSATATLGLLHGAGPLADRLSAWLPRPIALAIAVPTAAQLACQPVLILLDPALPAYGVLANLLADPAAPFATIMGLAACLLAGVAPPLALAAAWAAWLPATWIAAVAETTAAWPGARIPWPDGLGGCVALALPTLALAWLATPGATGARERLRRRVLALAVLATAAIVLGALLGRAGVRAATMPDPWRYAACDVGQGDALLIRTDAGVALIDTGPDPGPIAACLRELGVDRLSALVLTHFDHDHDGAAGELLDRVDALVVPDTEEAHAERLPATAVAAGVPVIFAGAGDALALGDLDLAVRSPSRRGDGGPTPTGGNDGSLGIWIVPASSCRRACLSLAALGDLGAEPQRALLARAEEAGETLSADVVKVSHHGSRDQHARLYAAIGAGLALVSVGATNGYGHPTSDALAMVTASGAVAARTDESGTLVVGGDPRAGIELWSEPGTGSR